MIEGTMQEFKIFKQSIEMISIYYGTFLVLWGVVITFISGSQSVTALIPSFFGLLLIIFAVLSIIFRNKQKLFMQLVATVGLLVFLGGADFFRTLIMGQDPFSNIFAAISKLMLFSTGFFFVFLCVQSFRFARKQKADRT